MTEAVKTLMPSTGTLEIGTRTLTAAAGRSVPDYNRVHVTIGHGYARGAKWTDQTIGKVEVVYIDVARGVGLGSTALNRDVIGVRISGSGTVGIGIELNCQAIGNTSLVVAAWHRGRILTVPQGTLHLRLHSRLIHRPDPMH